MKNIKPKVVVGMSGGVDSSVAACLLKEQGYEVVGVTIWPFEENGGCCGLSAVEDARQMAAFLGVPHSVMNVRQEFQDQVVDYFVREYLRGATPNPCIACNRYVKWESLLQRSLGIGAGYIATGHYARILRLDNGRYALKKSATVEKDQTYALYSLTQHQLAHSLMPIGDYTKEEIRGIAHKIGLRIADKPDSQEICFIPDHDYAAFIEKEASGNIPPFGNFVTRDGEILGKHKGFFHYTIGQRKGLNLAMGRPVFVTEIRPDTNEVVIGESEDVYGDRLFASKLNLMAVEDFEGTIELSAKIRYSHKGADCVIRKVGIDRIECTFMEPVRAITPGQAVVFYVDDILWGGGVIEC